MWTTWNIYWNGNGGWFDINLFEVWFFSELLPHIKEHRVGNEKSVVLGENLTYFLPEVIKTAVERNSVNKLDSHDATPGRGCPWYFEEIIEYSD